MSLPIWKPTRPVMKTKRNTTDVLIVGGGIHGCSAALHLAMRGADVTVLEKDHVARHASGVNAGGVRRLGRDIAEIPLAQAAWELWQDMPALVDDDCGYRKSRYLKIARSAEDLSAARQRVAMLRDAGFTHEEVIDEETLRRFLPSVAGHCMGALHVDGDGSALPFQTTTAFMRRAARFGVRFHEQCPVLAVDRVGGVWIVKTPAGDFEAPIVVNTAGAWGGQLAAKLGDNIPLEAHAPMLAITARMRPFVEPVVGVINGALSLKQFDNGTVLIGGGVRGKAYPSQNHTELDMLGMASFLKTARDVFPILRHARVVRTWAGIEGYTPDNLPIISLGREKGVVHSFGYSAHGFQLAPAAGKAVADLVLAQQTTMPVEEFRVDRFSS